MKKRCRVSGMVLCFVLAAALTASSQTAYEKYLTAADVDKATGMRSVTLVARASVPGAAGDLNFANDAGDLVLMVQFGDAHSFAAFRSKYGKTAVGGVGEQAVQGGSMPGMPDNLLAFTKGPHSVVLTAFGDLVNNKLYLTMNQLTALAKVVASRL